MDLLKKYLDQLNIEVSDNMISQFEQYMNGILEWNKTINLTAIKEKEEFIVKHYVDSILGVNLPEYSNANKIIDIGTGGGFPGVPLAIISTDKDFTLADSLNKRLKVINSLTEKIGILNINTVHGRAEELARKKEMREQYDLCVSRAVANMSVLLEYCLPFIKKDGYLLAYKGPDVENEIKASEKALKVLGGKIDRIEEVSLDGYNHNIVVIKKVKNTDKKYPRKAGVPTKEPI